MFTLVYYETPQCLRVLLTVTFSFSFRGRNSWLYLIAAIVWRLPKDGWPVSKHAFQAPLRSGSLNYPRNRIYY